MKCVFRSVTLTEVYLVRGILELVEIGVSGEKLGSVAMWRAATPKTRKLKACLGNFKAEYFSHVRGNGEIAWKCTLTLFSLRRVQSWYNSQVAEGAGNVEGMVV